MGRYAGDWLFDRKTGESHIVYSDQSEYRGGVKNGVKNGFGVYIWPKEQNSGSNG